MSIRVVSGRAKQAARNTPARQPQRSAAAPGRRESTGRDSIAAPRDGERTAATDAARAVLGPAAAELAPIAGMNRDALIRGIHRICANIEAELSQVDDEQDRLALTSGQQALSSIAWRLSLLRAPDNRHFEEA